MKKSKGGKGQVLRSPEGVAGYQGGTGYVPWFKRGGDDGGGGYQPSAASYSDPRQQGYGVNASPYDDTRSPYSPSAGSLQDPAQPLKGGGLNYWPSGVQLPGLGGGWNPAPSGTYGQTGGVPSGGGYTGGGYGGTGYLGGGVNVGPLRGGTNLGAYSGGPIIAGPPQPPAGNFGLAGNEIYPKGQPAPGVGGFGLAGNEIYPRGQPGLNQQAVDRGETSRSFWPPKGLRPGGAYAPEGRGRGYQGGSQEVRPIGAASGQQVYGPPVNLSAPDILRELQRAAKDQGLSKEQTAGLMKAVGGIAGAFGGGGGGMTTYGEGSGVSQALGPALEGAFAGGYQGGISDIGYPPGLAPEAVYHADKAGWLGPYDPAYMITRYWRGAADVGW